MRGCCEIAVNECAVHVRNDDVHHPIISFVATQIIVHYLLILGATTEIHIIDSTTMISED